ncbi:MAG: hypothetical protein OSB46_10745 [Alphaproteobacteria bacterium]|nr:hypothetical protein [Alphaproteobacteria bacterium]
MLFISASSLLLVVRGTLAATFVGQEARYSVLALKGIGSTFWIQRVNRDVLNQEVGRILLWRYLVQEHGFLSLEDEIKKMSRDPFLVFGVKLRITAYEGSDERTTLKTSTTGRLNATWCR